MMKKLYILGMALLVASCAPSLKAVPAGSNYAVNNSFQVKLDQAWAEFPSSLTRLNGGKLLTVDGGALNELQLVGGLEDGEPMIKDISKERPAPVYRAEMNDNELAEFIVDSLTYLGLVNVQSQLLRPAKFGAKDGLRFDITATKTKGLILSGKVLLAKSDDELNIIVFMAPQEHYFAQLAPQIENMMRTAQIFQ